MCVSNVSVNKQAPIHFGSLFEAERFLMNLGYERKIDPFGREFWTRGSAIARRF